MKKYLPLYLIFFMWHLSILSYIDYSFFPFEELEELILDENIILYENTLLENLKKITVNIIVHSKEFYVNPDNPNDLISFFHAFNNLNLYILAQASKMDMLQEDPINIQIKKHLRQAVNATNLAAASLVLPFNVDCKMGYSRFNIAMDINPQLKTIQDLLASQNFYEEKHNYRLELIYLLSHFAKKEFINIPLREEYSWYQTSFTRNKTCDLEKSEVMHIIGENTWHKTELSQNPYIMCLKNILEGLFFDNSCSQKRAYAS